MTHNNFDFIKAAYDNLYSAFMSIIATIARNLESINFMKKLTRRQSACTHL